jgi:hypothetical protein
VYAIWPGPIGRGGLNVWRVAHRSLSTATALLLGDSATAPAVDAGPATVRPPNRDSLSHGSSAAGRFLAAGMPARCAGRIVHADSLTFSFDDADMDVVLFDGPTTVLSVSQRRSFIGAVRQAIQARDRHCQHPPRSTSSTRSAPVSAGSTSKTTNTPRRGRRGRRRSRRRGSRLTGAVICATDSGPVTT